MKLARAVTTLSLALAAPRFHAATVSRPDLDSFTVELTGDLDSLSASLGLERDDVSESTSLKTVLKEVKGINAMTIPNAAQMKLLRDFVDSHQMEGALATGTPVANGEWKGVPMDKRSGLKTARLEFAGALCINAEACNAVQAHMAANSRLNEQTFAWDPDRREKGNFRPKVGLHATNRGGLVGMSNTEPEPWAGGNYRPKKSTDWDNKKVNDHEGLLGAGQYLADMLYKGDQYCRVPEGVDGSVLRSKGRYPRAGCKDDHEKCGEWTAQSGACQADPEIAFLCKKSCEECVLQDYGEGYCFFLMYAIADKLWQPQSLPGKSRPRTYVPPEKLDELYDEETGEYKPEMYDEAAKKNMAQKFETGGMCYVNRIHRKLNVERGGELEYVLEAGKGWVEKTKREFEDEEAKFAAAAMVSTVKDVPGFMMQLTDKNGRPHPSQCKPLATIYYDPHVKSKTGARLDDWKRWTNEDFHASSFSYKELLVPSQHARQEYLGIAFLVRYKRVEGGGLGARKTWTKQTESAYGDCFFCKGTINAGGPAAGQELTNWLPGTTADACGIECDKLDAVYFSFRQANKLGNALCKCFSACVEQGDFKPGNQGQADCSDIGDGSTGTYKKE